MPPESDETPIPPRWTAWKLLIVFVLLAGVFAGILFFSDEELQPAGDLLVPLSALPGTGRNGYVTLMNAWEEFPDPSESIRKQWEQKRDGSIGWNDGIVEALNPAGQPLRQELSMALRTPQWQAMAKDPSTGYESPVINTPWPFNAMQAEVLRQACRGNPEAAMALIEDLRLMARRQTSGSRSLQHNREAAQFSEWAVLLTCRLAAGHNLTEPALSRLSAIWEPEDLFPDDLIGVVSGEAHAFHSFLDETVTQNASGMDHTERLTLSIRKNAAINQAHRLLRLLRNQGLATAPTYRESLYPALKQDTPDFYSLSELKLDKGRDNFIFWVIAQPVQNTVHSIRLHLFRIRAMRLWLAIKRWQKLAPDRYPVSLEELVPEFLPHIPPDPWDGRSLRWDSGQQAIYSVGADWVPDLPSLPATDSKWFESGSGNGSTGSFAAMRLNLPPLPSAKPPMMPKSVTP